MTRRNFFNFVAGFFAGSLLPWPRRRRRDVQQWTMVEAAIRPVGPLTDNDMDRWIKICQEELIRRSAVPARYLGFGRSADG